MDDPTILMDGLELTPRQKEIFRLCTLTDMNQYGVAYHLDVSIQTVKNTLWNAKNERGAVTPTILRQMVLDEIRRIANESLGLS